MTMIGNTTAAVLVLLYCSVDFLMPASMQSDRGCG